VGEEREDGIKTQDQQRARTIHVLMDGLETFRRAVGCSISTYKNNLPQAVHIPLARPRMIVAINLQRPSNYSRMRKLAPTYARMPSTSAKLIGNLA
jgi:hypothetical protein